jgi:hypothetical protein
MVFFARKTGLSPILTAYLALAVAGAFTFAAAEPLPEGNLSVPEPISGGLLTPLDPLMDCVVGSGAVIDRAGGYSFSPVRNGSFRLAIPLSAQNAKIAFSYLSLKTNKNANHLNIKNTILLKLRI